MNNFEQKLKKASEEIRMTPEERGRVSAALLSHMSNHPLPASSEKHFSSIFTRAVSFAAIVLFAGGGVAFAAEGALPTDPLYPVKIHVTEAVRGGLALSGERKAEWQADLIERRLEEAEALALQRALTPELEEDVVRRIEVHAQSAEKYIAALSPEEEDIAEGVRSQIEAGLRAHEEILTEVAISREEGAEPLRLIGAVQETFPRLSSAQEGAMALRMESDASASAEKKPASSRGSVRFQERARMAIEEAGKNIEEADRLEEAEVASARRELDHARALFADGTRALGEENLEEAQALFRQSITISHRLKVYLRAETRLGISVLPRFLSERASAAAGEEVSSPTSIEVMSLDQKTATGTPTTSDAAHVDREEAEEAQKKESVSERAQSLDTLLQEIRKTGEQAGVLNESVREAQGLILRGRAALQRGDEGRASELFNEAQGFLGEALSQ